MAVSHVKSNTIGNFTGTVTVMNSAGSTVTANATDLVRPTDWNSVHNQFLTVTGNNTFSNTTASGTNLVYSGAGNFSIGGSSDTVIYSGPQFGSLYRNAGGDFVTTVGTAFASSVVSIQPFIIPYDVAASNVIVYVSQSVASAANTSSAYFNLSMSGGVYSMATGTAGSAVSVATFTNTYTASFNSNTTASVGGVQYYTASFATKTLTAGVYYFALQCSTANAATNTSTATTALGASMTMLLARNIGSAFFNARAGGGAANTTLFGRGPVMGLGLATGSNLTTATLNLTTAGFTGTGTAVINAPVYFELRNSTWLA